MKKEFMAMVRDRETKEVSFEYGEYESVNEMIQMLKDNNYIFFRYNVKEKEVFEYILNNSDGETWMFKKINKVGDSLDPKDYYNSWDDLYKDDKTTNMTIW